MAKTTTERSQVKGRRAPEFRTTGFSPGSAEIILGTTELPGTLKGFLTKGREAETNRWTRPLETATTAFEQTVGQHSFQELSMRQHQSDRDRIGQLEARVAQLERSIESHDLENGPTVDLDEIPDAEARKRVLEYFDGHAGEPVYPSDIAFHLCIYYDQVARIVDELEKEGLIAQTEEGRGSEKAPA